MKSEPLKSDFTIDLKHEVSSDVMKEEIVSSLSLWMVINDNGNRSFTDMAKKFDGNDMFDFFPFV